MDKAIQIAYDELFELKCDYAMKAGFDGIALNLSEILDKNDREWEEIIGDIQRILDKTGLKCVQTHPYYYDLLLSAEICEERYEYNIKKTIEAGGRLGAKWNVIHPRTATNSGYSTKAAFELNRKALSEYLEVAKKFNTGIAVENLPIFQIVPVMPFYSSNFEDLCDLVDSFDDECMKICWDTGHANLMNFDQADAIRFLGSRIKCTHIHNNFRKDDEHLPPDNGNIDWERVMSAFKEIGYCGPLTLETHCRYQESGLLKSFAMHNCQCLEFLIRMANK